ncbi:HAD-superfamily hydrolase, subfamily IA, variant 3 [Leptospira ryugenii]|uniref:HAD-superfamily hydrolase, subfamily IA, variant 3 n=2 Tax=Leptospira ryugenii TaxID=1917863 RepID=A0A2P2E0M5_9LEPT|nr:HAD-superfamily hydrolase, subfamily IA, variant 3 [Leptospira ryugenii]
MDGVILDSEKIYLDMNQKWFHELGFHLPIQIHQNYIGISASIFWNFLKSEFKLKEDVQHYIELEKELKFKTLSRLDLKPTDYLVDFLNFLKVKNCKIALASSSLRKNINLILSKLDVTGYFDFIISGEEVAFGKPNPDIFLKVSEFFNCSTSNCIVMEDSTNGIKAAKAANMFCVGYYNPNSGNQDLSQADLIINNFRDKRIFELIHV